METKKFTDGRTDRRTDAEGYNIIRPFFKRAYKNRHKFADQMQWPQVNFVKTVTK